MNNAARGAILAISLLGMGFMFVMTLDSMPEESDFKVYDLAGVIFGGFMILSCAVIAASALAGMKPSPPTSVTFPHQQQAVPPQGQAYPQPGAVQQPYAPQQYGQQQYGQQPRQD